MLKMFIGVYLIMVFDPQILFNDGFYPLLHIVIPDGCVLHPKFPSALGCRTHALARIFDVLGGALARKSPEHTTAAGYGTSPYMLYSGWDRAGEFYYLMEISYGGIPGRPIGDGMDGHSWWPLFQNIPTEYLEAYYPVRIDGYTTVQDSGGAGFHRGGNGIEKRYVYLEPGEVSIHDDRWLTYPWGILGGQPGLRSEKILLRADGTEERLPSKCDEVEVGSGDTLVYRTAGGGGWKDPLERPVERVVADVRKELVSIEKARSDYGVVIDPQTLEADEAATGTLRAELRTARGEVKDFDFGPDLGEILESARAQTGHEPPVAPEPLPWAAMESAEEAIKRVREFGDRQSTGTE
jgi:N-methylhydantoinase B